MSAEQRGDRVVVTLDRDGRRSEVSAAFVVGCDGAHSAVRHLLNLPFEGAQYEDLFLLADVETNDDPAPRTSCSCARASSVRWRSSP